MAMVFSKFLTAYDIENGLSILGCSLAPPCIASHTIFERVERVKAEQVISQQRSVRCFAI
ncbi:hypothetical protein SADUNF_Sadunf01G0177600 [Salix dunnii]|uniref:Uncharacterized protein n=1 Tax=Salix dunnii TaxID=1413687 RepID=A0A835NCS5_9ROSI|nr:hypothetical protein SADUNF_Sadunf01G0177600 [Salix dunnii]